MDINDLLKQVNGLSNQMKQEQDKINSLVYKEEVAGGAIKVEISGSYQINKIVIDEVMLNPENKEDLQDLLVMALNNALNKINLDHDNMIDDKAKNLNISGIF
ncbi:MAG: YbaB/EbfC family nucleoid-associated protein [Erysipelotrichaceae bacterium]